MRRSKIDQEEKTEEFIVVNELAQVFYGLKGGVPQFTTDWGFAKPIQNENQFKCVQRGILDKLEKLKI